MEPDQPNNVDYPVEFRIRIILPPAANNANAETQRNRNEAIRRDERHNERVRKSKAIYVDILSSCISVSLKNIFHDDYNINPYLFYGYLRSSFGPESNQNEDKSVAMHKLMNVNEAYRHVHIVYDQV